MKLTAFTLSTLALLAAAPTLAAPLTAGQSRLTYFFAN